MSKARRQGVLLAVLTMILMAVLYVRARNDTPTATSAAPSNPAVRGTTATSGTRPPIDVKLELLEGGRAEMPPPERNPFRFGARREVAAPRPVMRMPPPRMEAPAPDIPEGPPPPPPIPLRFIGVIELPGGGRLAVLSLGDGRTSPMHGREGQIVDGRYRIVRIAPDAIEMEHLDGTGRQRIRLSGQ